MKVKLGNVRLAFAVLFEPKPFQGEGEPRCSATLIIDPKDPQVKVIDAAIEEVAKEKWKDKSGAILAKLRSEGRVCFLKAARTNSSGEVFEGFEDTFSISSSNKVRPLVIDRDKTPLTQADGRPYAGCFVNASLELWAQDNNYGKRINATLKGVQFVRDGDAFTGGTAANPEEFDDLGVEQEAEEMPV